MSEKMDIPQAMSPQDSDGARDTNFRIGEAQQDTTSQVISLSNLNAIHELISSQIRLSYKGQDTYTLQKRSDTRM